MDRWVAGDDAGMRDGGQPSGEVCDDAACFSHEQHPGRDVPWRELQLPESIELPRSESGQVQRRRAGSPHAGGMTRDRGELRLVRAERFELGKRETCADEGSGGLGDRRDTLSRSPVR